MNKSLTIKVIALIVSAFIILTISNQVYLSMTDKYKTEEAVFYTVSETIAFDGIFVRNETVLGSYNGGVLKYCHADGSKIAKKSAVAEVYAREDDIEIMKKIENLEFELEQLERATNPGVVATAQPEFISKQIDERFLTLEGYIAENDFSKIELTRQELLVLMNIYSLITNAENKTVFSDRISEINSEIKMLRATVSSPVSKIITESPGYFVSYVDGFENSINLDNINSIGYDEINNITSAKIKQDTSKVGKIIDGYNWQMIGVIKTNNRFIKDKYFNIRLSGSLDLIPVKIEDIKETGNNNEYIAILSCDRLNYQLVQDRVVKAELVFEEFSGIKVDRKAIRFLNGEKGVYVAIGQNIMFRKLDVIYEGEDFVISRMTSDSSFISLYEQILFEEVKLNDVSSSKPESSISG